MKACHRDLVRRWHPDRFQDDPAGQDEASEMLKEINWAYEYLVEHAFAQPVEPAREADNYPVEEAPSGSSNRLLVVILVVAVLVVVGLFFYRRSSAPVAATATPPPSASPVVETAGPVSKASEKIEQSVGSSVSSAKNILTKMAPAHKLTTVEGRDGLILIPHDLRDYLQTPRSLRPPFVMKAMVNTGGNDFRFHYGLGIIIFNHWQKPPELYYYDFATGNGAPYPEKGAVTNTGWTEFIFDVRPDEIIASVDGEVRLQAKGFYQNLNTAPGIGPFKGEVIVKSVEIEEKAGPMQAATVPVKAGVNNLLPSMTAVDGVQVSTSPEGMILSDGPNVSGYFQTTQKFHAPFTIRTWAKTDGLNLRLYCGKGMVIFNWEPNPGELRVHDPISAVASAVGDRGRIVPNEWHEIAWEILSGGMRISVDGQVRFQNRKDYSKFESSAAIGPYLSKLTIASFTVEQK